MKSNLIISKIMPNIWQIICLITSIACFFYIVFDRSSNILRPISMALRNGFGIILILTTVIIYGVYCIRGRLGELLAPILTLSLFGFGLAGLWASGQTQSTVLNGLIPLYDAEAYYMDALRLLNGSKFSIFSARRPLFTGLLAVFLSWTGYNLLFTLAIFTGIVGVVCYFVTREIQRTHGTEVAIFVLIILFLFFRAHSGVSMSENLGFALGVLGFYFLWQGTSEKNILYLCVGLFITTLALNARAGAFFILPILILWSGWLLKNQGTIPWKPIVLATTAVAMGFAGNLLITRIIAVPSGIPFANFSYTLYGLASGGNSWVHVLEAHPEIVTIPEPDKSKKIYELAFELIRNQPLLTIKGALFNWKMLFSDSWYNIYSYVGGENWHVNTFAKWLMYILGLFGIYTCIQDTNDPVKRLVIFSFFGLFFSVPFLPPTDAYRMRPYAASIIILAALPALGLSFVLSKMKINYLLKRTGIVKFSSSSIPLVFSFLLISVMLIFPVLLYMGAKPISIQPVSCTSDRLDYILVRFNEGTYINIKKQNLQFLDWMPNYHIGDFKRNAHSLPDQELILWASSLEPPVTIFYTFDLNKSQKALVVLDIENLMETGKYYQICGYFETDASLASYRIFYASEAWLLPQ